MTQFRSKMLWAGFFISLLSAISSLCFGSSSLVNAFTVGATCINAGWLLGYGIRK